MAYAQAPVQTRKTILWLLRSVLSELFGALRLCVDPSLFVDTLSHGYGMPYGAGGLLNVT